MSAVIDLKRYSSGDVSADLFVDARPFDENTVRSALGAGFRHVIAFASDVEAVADAQAAFGPEFASGRLELVSGDPAATLKKLGPIWARSGVLLMNGATARPERLTRLATSALGSAGVCAVLIEGAKDLTTLPDVVGCLAEIDGLVDALRRAAPRAALRYDETTAAGGVFEASVGFGFRDDAEALAAALSDPDSLTEAAVDALDALSLPLSELPHHLPRHHARLGEIALRDGRVKAAAAHLARSVAIHPSDLSAQMLCADAALAAERWTDLETCAHRLVSMAPTNPEGFRFLSLAMEAAGRQAMAIDAARKAAALAVNGPRGYREALARLRVRLSDVDAIDALETADAAMIAANVAAEAPARGRGINRRPKRALETAPRRSSNATVQALEVARAALRRAAANEDRPVVPAPDPAGRAGIDRAAVAAAIVDLGYDLEKGFERSTDASNEEG